MKKQLLSFFPFILLLILLGYESYPNDPKNSLQEARGNTLRVGLIEAPPWIVLENGEVNGIEAEIVKRFAKQFNAEVEWIK